ncbi:PfaB family protein [Shewanella sp. GXUN23E]|uniref:PfaB family protein n=1 Tax=Shewanella sp. GXUN23E TaxID=3422498 RepID=UPI003D7DF1B5
MTATSYAPLALFLTMPSTAEPRPATVSLPCDKLLPALLQARALLDEAQGSLICLTAAGITGAQGKASEHPGMIWLMDSRQALKLKQHPHARLYLHTEPTSAAEIDSIPLAAAGKAAGKMLEYHIPAHQGFAALRQLCHSLAARDLPPAPLAGGRTGANVSDHTDDYADVYTHNCADKPAFDMPPDDATGSSICFSGQYWFCEPGDRRQVQLRLHGQSIEDEIPGQTVHTLTLTQGSALLPPRPIARYWLEYSAESAAELATQLHRDTGERTALNTWHRHNTLLPQGTGCRAVVVADTMAALEAELDGLIRHIETRPTVWLQTPGGSCYCPANQGCRPGELAFIYPGVGTAWAGMYQGLHLYFPELFEVNKSLPLAEMLQAEMLQADTLQSTGPQANRTSQNQSLPLAQQAVAGVGQSWLLSQILCREFGLAPDMALGYSMGEISMWASLGIWQSPESLIRPTLESALFSHELSGPLRAVQALWQPPSYDAGASGTQPTPDWGCYLLRASYDSVQQQIETLFGKTCRVYVPVRHFDSCILAGDTRQVQAVIDALGCTAIPSPLVTAMHTPAAWLLHQSMRAFYQLNTQSPRLLRHCLFFSASQPQAINPALSSLHLAPQDLSQYIADSIADTLCQPLNLPMLINRAIHQGARLFVEVGADRQLTSLLANQQLSWQPVKTIACNSKGAMPIRSLRKCIAALRTLGVNIRAPLAVHARTLSAPGEGVRSHISTSGAAPQETQYVSSR